MRPLGEIDSRYERLPAGRVKLTSAERDLLKDPDWIDEDEADLILAMREEKQSNPNDGISLDDYMRIYGRVVRNGRSEALTWLKRVGSLSSRPVSPQKCFSAPVRGAEVLSVLRARQGLPSEPPAGGSRPAAGFRA